MVAVALVLSLMVNVGLLGTLYLFRLRKILKRGDMDEVLGAIQDFEQRRGCIVQVRKLDPSELYRWRQS